MSQAGTFETPVSPHKSNDTSSDSEMTQIQTIVNKAANGHREGDALSRVFSFCDTVSGMSYAQMKAFKVDPNDPDLQCVLRFISSHNVAHGTPHDKTSVVYEDMKVVGSSAATGSVSDLRSTLLPFLDRRSRNQSPAAPKREVIYGATGFAIPGTMTLVLGRPGAGCTSFLRSLGGDTRSCLKVEGTVEYNGIPSDQMVKNFRNQLVYVPEVDDHFPHLTVAQTLRFAVACKTSDKRSDGLSRDKYITSLKDLYTALANLLDVQDKFVGNNYVRGISGGQRKRLSAAEAIATGATVFCYDSTTRGLDASTALDFVRTLRAATNVVQTTTFVTAYQASENIYRLFDYVTLLYAGRQVYFGPAQDAVDFFVRLGFEKDANQTSTEFLSTVTDPTERKVRAGFETKVPQNAEQFEQYWRSSPEYAATLEKIGEIRAECKSSTTITTTPPSSLYTVGFMRQFWLCMDRVMNNIVHDKAYTVVQMGNVLVQGFIMGSLFYNSPQDTMGTLSRGGCEFFSLLAFLVMSVGEVANTFVVRPILSRQRGYTFYHPSAEYVAVQVVQLCILTVEFTLFTVVYYFLSGLRSSAGAFFTFILFGVFAIRGVQLMFGFISSLLASLDVAGGITGMLSLAFILYSTFIVQMPTMHWWFRWFVYLNPVLYGIESMVTAEFRHQMMPCAPNHLIPGGPGYESVSRPNQICGLPDAWAAQRQYPHAGTHVNGDAFLSVFFDYHFRHTWRNFGILLAFNIGFLVINAVIVEHYNPVAATSNKLKFVRGGRVVEESKNSMTPATVAVKPHPDEVLSEPLGSDDVLTWKNVNYTVRDDDGTALKLLSDVQGYVLPGTITALMGEVGAGKTTLLNVLSQRVDVGVVTGDFLVNGRPLGRYFSRRTGYVQNRDLHLPEMTVRESLLFAATLRRPRSVPDSEKVEYVDKIMRILHMDEYADAVAGEPGYGLNVEQRKKLSIATELVAKPEVLLFLDEPTSGLDSTSASAIVEVLRQLAAAGQAILCTILQPSAALFEQFDRLLLLERGGVTTYFGPIGENSHTVLHYFEQNGARPFFDGENPAEYVLDVTGAGVPAAAGGKNWGDVWANSPECQQVSQQIDQLVSDSASRPADPVIRTKFATPYWYQLRVVVQRTWLGYYRDVDYVGSKLVLFLVTGLIAGFTFWNLNHTVINAQMAVFANFMPLVMSASIIGQIQAKAVRPREVYEAREAKAATFHWSILLLSHLIVELPYSIVCGTIHFLTFYLPTKVSYSAADAGFWWFTYSFFVQIYFASFAIAIVYASPDLPWTGLFTGFLINFFLGFCGCIQSVQNMPRFWHFMWRAVPFTYFLENLGGVFLHGQPVRCDPKIEMAFLDPPAGSTCGQYLNPFFENAPGYVDNPEATANCAVCAFENGDQYLAAIFNIYYSHHWRNIGFFCVYIAGNLVFMISLYYIFRVKGVTVPKLRFGKSKKEKEVVDEK